MADGSSMNYPPRPSRVGKRGLLRIPPRGDVLRFTVEGEIFRPQSDLPSKLICLQRVRFDDGRMEVRLGYYIIGKKPRMRGKWVWGQYATLMPIQDFRAIVREARARRWL